MSRTWSVAAAVAVWATAGAFAQTPVDGAFTYQGQLKDQGQPAGGPYNMQFRLYAADAGGTPLATYPPGSPMAVTVQDGLFTALIDFGIEAFNGERRWVEVVVEGVTLAPRQELTVTPYALFALNGPGIQSFWEAGVGGTIYYNTGSVGIGTATPSAPLTVNGVVESQSGGFKFPDGTMQATAATSGALDNHGPNPLQIALLRWYDVNCAGVTYTVSNEPRSLAFDGDHIYVLRASDYEHDGLTKLRTSDVDSVGGKDFGSADVRGVAFDGANIWVTDAYSRTVMKLRARDLLLLGTYDVLHGPRGVAFDGAAIWVACADAGKVRKLRASDGGFLGDYLVGNGCIDLAIDGANIWVANSLEGTVTKLRASDGAELGTYTVGEEGYSPSDVAFDGTSIWVPSYHDDPVDDVVTKLRASDGAVLGNYTVGRNPAAVAFDGASIWVANYGSNNVTKLRASDGAVLGTYPVGPSPRAIAFDGANIWVACADGTLWKL
ncbi:MAG: hypothetical protein KA383_20460 [Phycisphaerae bacterium]|nr:hypothetical protein [Phycisphaerae bacterium]